MTGFVSVKNKLENGCDIGVLFIISHKYYKNITSLTKNGIQI